MTRQRGMAIAARRGFASFAIVLMLLSVVPHPALAQTNSPVPLPESTATLDVRIVEEVASAYNSTGRTNASAAGRVIVNNTGNRTLANATVRLNSTTAAALGLNDSIPVPELPPGQEAVVATYNLTSQPRLVLSQEWRSITTLEGIEQLFQEGTLKAAGRQLYSNPHGLLYGVDNVLEFNVTVSNTGDHDLAGVTLSGLLPMQTPIGFLTAISSTSKEPDPYGGVIALGNISESLTLPLLRNNTSTTLTLRATLLASAFTDPEQASFDLRHEIRATYSLETRATQELGGVVTPEQQRQQEVLKLAVEQDETQRRIQESLDVSPVTDTIQTLEAEAWSMPSKLRAEAFQRAKDLGIPVNNSTFANELENQTKNATKEVVGRLPFLMEQFRKAHEAKIDDYAKIAGSIHKQGKAAQVLMDELGLDVNESLRREAFERVATQGYSEEVVDLLHAQGFNDTQIALMKSFTAAHLEELIPLNLTQTHDQLRDGYVQAIKDSANLSTFALQNSMFFNRQANLTSPLGQAGLEVLSTVQHQAVSDLDARNWTGLRSSAKDLAVVTYFHALQTGAPIFADRYRNATIAWAAAEVALSGDNETAAAMVEGLRLESHIYGFFSSQFTGSLSPGDIVVPVYPINIYLSELPPSGGFQVAFRAEVRGPLDAPGFQDRFFDCTQGPFQVSGPAALSCDFPVNFPEPGQYGVYVSWVSNGESARLGGFQQVQIGTGAPGGGGGGGGTTVTPQCRDEKDNDGDKKVDFQLPTNPANLTRIAAALGINVSNLTTDPGCSSPDDNDETNAPLGQMLAIGEAVDGAGIRVPAKITLTLSEPGGIIGSRTSTTGRVEFPLNVSSGVTVQTDLFCPAETATHRLTGTQNAQGGLGTVSGNVLRATCTYELKPGQVVGSIRGFVRSEVGNPLEQVGVNARFPQAFGGVEASTFTSSFGFYQHPNLPTPGDYVVTYSKQPISGDLSEIAQTRATEVREVPLGLKEDKRVDVTMRFAGDGLNRGYLNIAERTGVLRFQAAYNAWQKGTVDALIGIWCDGICVDLDPHNPYKWWGDKVGTVYFAVIGIGSGVAAGRAAVSEGAKITLQTIFRTGNAIQLGQLAADGGYDAIVKQDFSSAGFKFAFAGLPFLTKIPGVGQFVGDAMVYARDLVARYAVRFGEAAQRVLGGLGRAMGFEGADLLAAAAARLESLGISAATRLGLLERGASITVLDDAVSEIQRATAAGQAQGLDDVLKILRTQGSPSTPFGHTFQLEEAAKLTRTSHSVVLEGKINGLPRDIVVDNGQQAWELKRFGRLDDNGNLVTLTQDKLSAALFDKGKQLSDLPQGVQRVLAIDARQIPVQGGFTVAEMQQMAQQIKNDFKTDRITILTQLGDIFL